MKWPYVSGRIIQIGFTNDRELKLLPNTNSRIITLLGNLKWNTGTMYWIFMYTEVKLMVV